MDGWMDEIFEHCIIFTWYSPYNKIELFSTQDGHFFFLNKIIFIASLDNKTMEQVGKDFSMRDLIFLSESWMVFVMSMWEI